MRTAKPGVGRATHAVLVAVPVVVAVIVGCSSGSGPGSAADDGDGATTTTEPEDIVVDADDFRALADMTPVRGFYIDNLLGHLDEAVEVAESPDGGVYPVGTVIQLIPQEAMVKRAPGFDPDSNDWEFFTLEVSPEGTTIVSRGGSEVVNRFSGSSCASCHGAAEPQFDFVCEDTHGCAPLPVGDDVITAIQQSDPRPRR
ncbi:MAG TPA: hypothetical protein VF015_14255 [Acidimicrobiales bacterium]